jgi:SMODS domain-containing protein
MFVLQTNSIYVLLSCALLINLLPSDRQLAAGHQSAGTSKIDELERLLAPKGGPKNRTRHMSQTAARRLTSLSVQSRSHRRLAAFVDWIKPEPENREAIRKQADDIRRVIGGQAQADGLSIVSTPEAGSFAKHTGLRRHMRGHSEIEGQDVDLPFAIKPSARDGTRIDELLSRFERYAATSYPNTPRTVTASSVELRFVASKLNYDLVPMLAAAHADHQTILKKDGSRRLTSTAKHTEFVRRRTRQSDDLAGRVKFNACVRLLKWLRYVRIGEASAIEEVRTTLIELLCASAYDRLSVESTYTETLLKWFGWLATVTARRMTVSFNDYPTIEPANANAPGNRLWKVLDPVNVNNNVVHTDWGNIELDEFASWFAAGRDAFTRLIAHESAGNDGIVDAILAELFGNPILTHGEVS